MTRYRKCQMVVSYHFQHNLFLMIMTYKLFITSSLRFAQWYHLLVKYHFIVIEPMNSGARLPVCECQLFHSLALWTWAVSKLSASVPLCVKWEKYLPCKQLGSLEKKKTPLSLKFPPSTFKVGKSSSNSSLWHTDILAHGRSQALWVCSLCLCLAVD